MKNKVSLKFKLGDIAVIAAAILIAVSVFLFFLPKGTPARLFAEIKQNGVLIASLPLDTDTEYTITDNYVNTVKIEDHSAFFLFSDCPNNDCVRLGKLNKAGDIAVCLPNGVTLQIVGATPEIDAIAG